MMYSEMKHITEPEDLKDMMLEVFREGLEGLVLKDVMVSTERVWSSKMLWLVLGNRYSGTRGPLPQRRHGKYWAIGI